MTTSCKSLAESWRFIRGIWGLCRVSDHSFLTIASSGRGLWLNELFVLGWTGALIPAQEKFWRKACTIEIPNTTFIAVEPIYPRVSRVKSTCHYIAPILIPPKLPIILKPLKEILAVTVQFAMFLAIPCPNSHATHDHKGAAESSR